MHERHDYHLFPESQEEIVGSDSLFRGKRVLVPDIGLVNLMWEHACLNPTNKVGVLLTPTGFEIDHATNYNDRYPTLTVDIRGFKPNGQKFAHIALYEGYYISGEIDWDMNQDPEEPEALDRSIGYTTFWRYPGSEQDIILYTTQNVSLLHDVPLFFSTLSFN